MAQAPDLLTTSEAAEFLKVSPETIRRWVKAEPPLIRYVTLPSGRVRFHRSDLVAALKTAEPAA